MPPKARADRGAARKPKKGECDCALSQPGGLHRVGCTRRACACGGGLLKAGAHAV